jgi:hypothetical protein
MLIPQTFQGTEQQKEANYFSHHFNPEDGRCIRCDSKMWHKAAEYPCGQEPPMIEVSEDEHKAEHPILGQFYRAMGTIDALGNSNE